MNLSASYWILTVVLATYFSIKLSAQQMPTLQLEDCYEMAESHYPLAAQWEIAGQMAEIYRDNLDKELLPSLAVLGQASYQSAVTKIPLEFPGMDIQEISKDQYRLYADAVQPLTHVQRINRQKELALARSEIDQQMVSVQLHQLKARINDLFFGGLLIDRQIMLTDLLLADLQAGIERVQVAMEHGQAIRSDLDQLHVRQIEAEQQVVSLKSRKSALRYMLGSLIGQKITDNVEWLLPDSSAMDRQINRPEMELYRKESEKIQIEQDLLEFATKPQLAAFVQAGLGRPALNFLDPDFQPYFIAGVRLNWQLNGLFTRKNDEALLSLKQQRIVSQRDLFLLNTQIELDQEIEELISLRAAIRADREIINMRVRIKETAQTQLENGVITTSEYITLANEEDRARQNLLLHQIELIKKQYQIKAITGN